MPIGAEKPLSALQLNLYEVNMAKKNNRKRSTGWAHTKKYPHKNHPAYFRKTGPDDVEYVTFTNSCEVDFDKDNKAKPIEKHDIVKAQKLKVNIDKTEKNKGEYSHVVPRVYEGKRSALGAGTNKYKLAEDDKTTVDYIFKNGKRYKVPRTGNKPKNKKPRK